MRKFKNWLRNKIWVFLKARWKLISGLNIVVENDSDWFVYNEIFANKEYDAALSHLLNGRLKNPLIIDLGANVGYFTLKVADELIQAGVDDFEIISLEASPANYQPLSQRTGQDLLKGKVKAFLGLAGYRTGSHTILYSAQHYGHSAMADQRHANSVTIDYIDIEKLMAGDGRKIDFLKCDIEGSEEIFINEYSGLLKRVEHAVFEFHAGECDVQRCRQLLTAAGLLSKGVIKEDPAFKTSVEIFSRH
jgi:FkbM family methyltransferase